MLHLSRKRIPETKNSRSSYFSFLGDPSIKRSVRGVYGDQHPDLSSLGPVLRQSDRHRLSLTV